MKSEFVSKIQSYVNGTIDLNELENWYVPELETLIFDPETSRLVAQLELELAELADKIVTEEQVKIDLGKVLRNLK